MIYKFPLRIPEGRRVSITQNFKDTALVAWYKAQGINITSHEAVDAVCGNAAETYGTPLCNPFPSARLYAFVNDPDNPVTGGKIQISYKDEKGRVLIMGGLHLFDLQEKTEYKKGDILGYIGNYGTVLPKPTIGAPFAGSHLHLTMWVDGTVVDPLLWFNVQDPFRGADTGIQKDQKRINWAIQAIKDALRKFLP